MLTETIKPKKSPLKLSPEKKAARIAELKAKLAELKQQDPFWYFIPNDGVLNETRRAFLRRYLKEEDIPERVDSQLDVLLCKAEVKGVSGGNRSSKTVSGTISGIIKSTGELPEALECYRESHFKDIIARAHSKVVMGRVTAVDAKQLQRVVLPKWKYWVPREYLKNGNFEDSYSKQYDILTLYRKGKECAVVEFLTNAQDVKSSQGGDLDWAVFDEEPDRDKYKETLMRFGTAARLDIEIDWTPTEGLTWATDIFHGELDNDELGGEDRVLLKLTSVCNPHVQLDTLQKIMDEYAKVSSYDEMKMRLLGEAISLSGLVYGQHFKDSLHVIEPFELNPYQHFILRGIDPHLVKPSCCVELAVDPEGNKYVIGAYGRDCDTREFKKDLADRVKEKKYRLGWSIFDKSSDSTIKVFGDRNIFLEMTRGENAVPAAFKSDKFTGSINAGVDEIKKSLKVNEKTKKPTLFFFNTPEVKPVIKAMKSLERDTYTNEEDKGMKDRIKEGKWDYHACLRYLHQRPIVWLPPYEAVPEVQEERYI